MPYLRGDADAFDEILSEMGDDLPPDFADKRPSDDFEYEPAETRFDPAALEPPARAILDALLARGATTFRVRYDGGYDEGFAHPESITFDQTTRPAEAVADDLATPEIVAQLRKAAASRPYNNYEDVNDTTLARYAVDELAHALASKLLGDGYGTGEYQLYGAFTADLRTGQITDDPAAPKPADME